jgi:ubiquinone/menaquinone biosynthesis C-methylase UbiE
MYIPTSARWLLVGVLTAAAAAPVGAQLAGRPAEEWIKTLDGTARVSALKIPEVVAALRLQPGDTVADIGAGTGIFTVPLAKAVGPKGKVYAVEIDRGFFPPILKRAADAGVKNVETILGAFTDPRLPVRNVDVAFFHDVLHHIEYPPAYLKTVAGYLAPDGRIAVVDFEGGKGPHREAELQVPREQLVGWMQDAGLKLADDVKLFEDKYVLVFSRR